MASMDHVEDMASHKVQEKLTFLDLPPELRNKIYKLILVEDELLHVVLREELPQSAPGLWKAPTTHRRCNLPHLQKDDSDTHRLAITATCKHIRKESFSLFLGNNTFNIKFGDKVPASNDHKLLRHISRTRVLHLRGWLSYLGAFKHHLCHIEVDLGLHKHDFDSTYLIDTFKDFKAAFHASTIATIIAQISVRSIQPVGMPAIAPLTIRTDAVDLEDALRALRHDLQRKKNWITSRDEPGGYAYQFNSAMWRRDGVKGLERLEEEMEALFRALDSDRAWRWNGVAAS